MIWPEKSGSGNSGPNNTSDNGWSTGEDSNAPFSTSKDDVNTSTSSGGNPLNPPLPPRPTDRASNAGHEPQKDDPQANPAPTNPFYGGNGPSLSELRQKHDQESHKRKLLAGAVGGIAVLALFAGIYVLNTNSSESADQSGRGGSTTNQSSPDTSNTTTDAPDDTSNDTAETPDSPETSDAEFHDYKNMIIFNAPRYMEYNDSVSKFSGGSTMYYQGISPAKESIGGADRIFTQIAVSTVPADEAQDRISHTINNPQTYGDDVERIPREQKDGVETIYLNVPAEYIVYARNTTTNEYVFIEITATYTSDTLTPFSRSEQEEASRATKEHTEEVARNLDVRFITSE